MTDQLLRDYVQTGSESAFRELVDRYINLVYSTAYRRLGGDAHLAQDTVQTVFSDLARKASTLPAAVMLGGWLHRHTCFVTGAMLRTNRRREAREKEAMEIFASCDDWQTIAPMLDEAVNQLAPADRDAVILRFFEGLDFRTIGARIGSNEDAAQKRVSRAVEKLRTLLEQRGATLSAAGLATLLGGESILAAPVGLAARVASNALVHAAARVGLLATLLAIFTPAKLAVVAAALIALLGVFAWKQSSSPPKDAPQVQNSGIVSVAPTPGDNLTAKLSSPEETATTPQTNVLRLTILAADSGKPVPNVTLKYRASTDTGVTSLTLTARRDGTCDVPFPPPHTTRLTLVTQLDDFADTRLEWNPPRGQTIPTSYTLRLQRPVTIGGRVLDPDGQPVAGAKIGFNHQEDPAARKLPQNHEFSWIEVVTGDDGRWEIRRIAPDMIRRLYGGARHSNYVSSGTIFVDRLSEAEEQLKAGTHVFKLGPAAIVRGVVTDQQGLPIGAAEVLVGTRGYSGARTQTAAADGSFAVAGCKPGKTLLTAEAKGFAATTIEIDASSDSAPFTITLAPGKTLRVRVIDKAGQPIKGANLYLENFRRGPIDEKKSEVLVQSSFRPKTDESGRIVWDSTPDTELTFDVDSPEHMRVSNIKLRPDSTEHVVVLPNAVKVSGAVRDAETAEPISRFRIVSGWPESNSLDSNAVSWSGLERHWLDFSGGTFKHTFREPLLYGTANRGYVLRFEAEGYAPFISRTILPDELHAEFDVKLRASTSNAVVVLSPDGRAAPDADVALVSATASLRLTPNGFARRNVFDRGALLTTDAKGRFTYIPDDRQLRIIAVHPLGYAEATPPQLRAEPVLRLQPWGRLEGTLTSNGKPVSAQQLSLDLAIGHLNSVSLDSETFESKTDAEGRFTFPKVPPTSLRLQRIEQSPGANSWTHMPLETVEVASGETTIIRLDGRDRTFAIQLRWPEGLTPDPKWHIHVSLEKPIAESPPGPLHAARTRTYFLQAADDGSYTARDLLPGEYRVHARVLSQPSAGSRFKVEALGDSRVSVPDSESGVIEIGDLQLAPPAQGSN